MLTTNGYFVDFLVPCAAAIPVQPGRYKNAKHSIFAVFRCKNHHHAEDPSVHTLKGGERDVTNNLFALLGAVVSLVPGLVERTGLAGTLGDLVLLEVFAANA